MKDPHKYVAALLAGLPTETVADIMSEWVGVWDDPEGYDYTPQQADDIEAIHAELCQLRPDARDLASSR